MPARTQRVAARNNGARHAKSNRGIGNDVRGRTARRFAIRRPGGDGVLPVDAAAAAAPQTVCTDAAPEDSADAAAFGTVRHGGRAGC